MTGRDERVRDERGMFTTAAVGDGGVVMYEVDGPLDQFLIDPPASAAPAQHHTAIVIGTAKDALAAACVLDWLDRMPVGESPIERAEVVRHDER